MTTDIPRIIHQTWKTDRLPAEFAPFVEAVRAHHPDWAHRLWTDADNRALIATHFPWFLETYDGYRHNIERADAVRYFILLRFGGVYLDLDMECLKPLDPLLEPGTVHMGLLANPGIDDSIIGNAFMAAPLGHPFFEIVCRRLAEAVKRDITFQDVFDNTGPHMLARRVAAFSSMFAFKIIGLDDVCDRIALCDNPKTRGKSLEVIRRDALLYLIHHHTNSWNIQYPPPSTVPEDFVLLTWHDIMDGDVGYLEYSIEEYQALFEAVRRDEQAIGFNYNGFIKSVEGRLQRQAADNSWLKPGMIAWVCIKRDAICRLRGAEGPPA